LIDTFFIQFVEKQNLVRQSARELSRRLAAATGLTTPLIRPFTVALCYSDTYSLRMRSSVATSSVLIDNLTQCHVSAEISNRWTAMLTMERRLVLLSM